MPLVPSIARKVRMGFLPQETGEAAFAIFVLASLRQESESPMVSHPYITDGTAAVRAMSVVLTPMRLSALYLGMLLLRSASLFLKPAVDLRAPATVSVPRSFATLAMLVQAEWVALTMAAAMEGLDATTLDFLADTVMSMESSSTCTAKSIAWANCLMTCCGCPVMESVRSST